MLLFPLYLFFFTPIYLVYLLFLLEVAHDQVSECPTRVHRVVVNKELLVLEHDY